MKVDLSTILPIAIAVAGLLWTYFGAIINIKERLTKLETKAELFWKPLQDYLTEILHHPDAPSLDRKLENFTNLKVEDYMEMKIELKAKIEELKGKDKSDPKLFFYVLMLSRVEQLIEDKRLELCKPFRPFYKKVTSLLFGRT